MEFIEEIRKNLRKFSHDPIIINVFSLLDSIESKISALEGVEKNEKSHSMLVNAISHYISEYNSISKHWKEFKGKNKETSVIFITKMQTLDEMLDVAYQMPSSDLCWLDSSDPRQIDLLSIVDYIEPEDIEAVKKAYNNFIQTIVLSNAFMSLGFEESNTFKRNLMIGLGAIYYFFFKNKAKKQAVLFHSNPRTEVAQCTWNLLDSWLCSAIVEPLLENIEVNRFIYLPKNAPHVLSNQVFSQQNDFSFTEAKDFVPVRVLCDTKLEVFDRNFNNSTSAFDFCYKREGKEYKKYDKIIFHIHGGGFISMSSKTHQSYTRKWSNELKCPVFSVDYGLAPQNPFPNGLDDVWQSYYWLVNNIENLAIKAEKIIVTGDSAGGNLVLGLIYKCILTNFRVPDGAILSYPAVDLELNTFKKSMLLALEDMILPHTFLKLCVKCYLPDPSLFKNEEFFISPTLAPDDILKKLPKIRVITGDNDPLFDMCLIFVEKLLKAGVDVKCDVFRGATHGVLSFLKLKEAENFYQKTVERFNELLGTI